MVATVCWDDQGHFLRSSSITYASISILEALACRDALALAGDLIARRILISSDCQMVIKDLEENVGVRHGMIIREIEAHAEEHTFLGSLAARPEDSGSGTYSVVYMRGSDRGLALNALFTRPCHQAIGLGTSGQSLARS